MGSPEREDDSQGHTAVATWRASTPTPDALLQHLVAPDGSRGEEAEQGLQGKARGTRTIEKGRRGRRVRQ